MKDKNFQHAIDFAKARLFEDGELLPMFHGFGTKDNGEPFSMVIATPFTGKTFEEVERSKDMACQFVSLTFAAHGIESYVFMSESWMKKSEDEVFKKRWEEHGPYSLKDAPGRIEALVLYHITREKSECAQFEMVRDAAGKLIRLDEIPMGGDIKLGGRMAKLLPRQNLSKTDRALAQAVMEEWMRRNNMPNIGFNGGPNDPSK